MANCRCGDKDRIRNDLATMITISDKIDAATNHKYAITYSHSKSDPDYWFIPFYDPTYWEADPTRQCNAAFAEIFASEMCGDQKEIDFIKQNFGDVYDRYQDLCVYMETAGEKQ